MTERIKIYPWATDTAGCFVQRLKMPLDALEANYPDEFEVCWTCEPKAGDGDARSVVLGQRIMGNGTEGDPRWLDYCRNPGIMAVYEIDDDIVDLDPGNTVPYNIFTPNRQGTIRNIGAADCAIVSTMGLFRKLTDRATEYLPGEHVYVAPNCVADGSVIERANVNPDGHEAGWPITVGWAGSMFHQQDFPSSLVEQLAAVRDAHPDVRWLTIGANYLGWGDHVGWGPMDRYHQALMRMDIGICPIARTPFNASKSWIKALDYMHRGVVPVVEDWGQYPELIEGDGTVFWHLIGMTVPDWQNAWVGRLEAAIEAFRDGVFDHHAIAERAREFEISRQIGRWADVFRKAAQ